jgi:ABC-type phosphate transport system auxiliary subunit
VAISNIYQALYEAKLDARLENLLLDMLRFDSSANVQEPIRIFLYNYQIMSDNFWTQYKAAKSYEDILECYYQFSKNQCTVIETLLENLRLVKKDAYLKEDLRMMLRDAFTF